MRFIVCLILSLLVVVGAYSQNDVSKLLSVLKQKQNDSLKVETYSKIFRYYKYSNPDSAIYYLNTGIDLFKQKQYQYGVARLIHLQASEDIAQGHLGIAKKRETEALNIFEELHDTNGIAMTENGIGVVEARNGNYEIATQYFMKALKGYEHTSNMAGVQATYIKLGAVNEQFNNLSKALDYYKQAINLAKQVNDSINIPTIENNIGVVFGKQGAFNKAISSFQSAYEHCNHAVDIDVRILSLNNLGVAYDQMGKSKIALKYLDIARQITQTQELPEQYARTTINMASVISHTDMDSAIGLFKQGLEAAKKIGQKNLQLEVLSQMIDAYKEKGNYRQAMATLEQKTALHDTLFNIQKAREIANLQSVYDLEKSNEKVHILKKANDRNMMQRNIIIMVALVLFISLIALLRSYQKTTHLNAELSAREAELAKSNSVKDKLFSIIGHDLKGPISTVPVILEMFKNKMTSEDEKKYLIETLSEQAIASQDTLEKLLYWGQSQIKGVGLKKETFDAQDHLQDTIKLINSAAKQKHIAVQNMVPIDTFIYADPDHFDFVIRNLLSNAIKFTYDGGMVEIGANKIANKGMITFYVKDNGVGMDATQLTHVFEAFNSTPGTANEKGTSIGLMLCKEFVAENGGDIWAESEKGKGSTFYFSMRTAS